jgi:hypothetical protein
VGEQHPDTYGWHRWDHVPGAAALGHTDGRAHHAVQRFPLGEQRGTPAASQRQRYTQGCQICCRYTGFAATGFNSKANWDFGVE